MNHSILLPHKPFLTEESDRHAKVVIEGLHPGYGVTLGNALRRVLFSSLPGAAVTRVKIAGVSHEFSTVPGVLEDVLLILLNIKQLRFKVFSDDPETVTFESKGEGEIKAGDIKTSSTLEIVNKDQHIATITKKNTNLSLEFTVERGVGYKAKEVLERERVGSGTIVLDAIFTPVRKVSYNIENMRVGTETDYNRLIMNIETDGTITPREAFAEALSILIAQLSELKEFGSKEERNAPEHKPKEAVEEGGEADYRAVILEDARFSGHTLNALFRAGYKTLGDLAEKTENELRATEGIGEKAMQEIHRELGNFGVTLPKEEIEE
ncbi:MAG: DNA-directed RNA polymerase subunit alpha [Candidatus Ryanbacteria bacterium]|nr:DNA-directed RNA polymerase subunit alpha [Candidatus Ryanbacteria bacterium]